jgi:hypothetical protein
MKEFVILKVLNMKIHPPKIKEILWHTPIISWIKCNLGEAAHGSLDIEACGGVFRDYQTNFLGCYASNIDVFFALYAEFIGATLAFEIALDKVDIITG